MAVSSLKGCWSKLSTRIRDYIDLVDSYYRPTDELEHHNHHHHHHHHHHHSLPTSGGRGDAAAATVAGDSLGLKQQQHQHQRTHRCGRKDCPINSVVQLSPARHPTLASKDHNHSHNNTCCKHLGNSQQRNTHHDQHDSSTVDRLNARIANHQNKQHSRHANNHQVSPRHNKQNCLSLGYTKRKTAQGQVYFVDLYGHKFWHDPSVPKELLNAALNLDLLVGRLSNNWESKQTGSGRTYYINHAKKTTQFTDPRLVVYKDQLINYLKRSNTYQEVTAANNNTTTTTTTTTTPTTTTPTNTPTTATTTIPTNHPTPYDENNNRELFDKISILRQELLKQQVLSHPCRIDVSRKRIFEESFKNISQLQPRDLKKRLLVKFRGEEGLDYGGVAREWFYLLSREILNPVHGLFQYTSDDIYNLQINPDSGIVYREHLSYMNFCGRVIGMAVFHGHFIEGHFTLPFYKMLLGKPITLDDIEYVDPELHQSLCWILDNDITDVIDTTFLVQHNAFGQLQEHELKDNGRNIVVTEDNKHEYVSLYVNYRCRRGIDNQFEALQRGFHELVSPCLVEKFNERELELLIGGLSKINIEDWRLHTRLKNCTVETPMILWFWDIVKSYDEEKRARLLQFVTGSPRVPIQGFKALQGVNSELRLFTIHLIRNASTDNLPKSHTCFNRIDLPSYESYDKLRDKLTQAIEETMGFAMQ